MKNNRKFEKSGRVAATDSAYTGQEPEGFEGMTNDECKAKFSKALNFYNYYLNRDDYIPIIQEYMVRNHYTAKDVAAYKHLPKTIGSIVTTGKIARMYNRGMPNWNEDYKEQLDNGISSTLSVCYEILRRKKSEPKQTNVKPKPNVHEIMKEKVRTSVLCELEGMLDTWCTSDTKVVKFPIASVLRGENIPVSAIGDVKEWLTKQRNEYNEAFEKTCDQMVEGYSFLSKRELNKWVKTLEKMKAEVDKYEKANTKAIVRVKKVKPAGAQVRDMNYDKENSNVSAVKIPGSIHVVLFNQKTRKLQKYSALTRNGLSVRGTTIKDFDKDKSQQFTVRANQVKSVLATKDLVKAWDKLKGNKQPVNGRVNEHCRIILCK